MKRHLEFTKNFLYWKIWRSLSLSELILFDLDSRSIKYWKLEIVFFDQWTNVSCNSQIVFPVLVLKKFDSLKVIIRLFFIGNTLNLSLIN